MDILLSPADSLASRVPELLVIVPIYRNAPTLRVLAQRILAALENAQIDGRLLFVVDASPDDSWDTTIELAADSRITGLLLKRNVGQHHALMCGLMAGQAQWYAILDGDLQDPPEIIPQLLRQAQQTGATVMVSRVGRYQSVFRMMTSRLFKYLIGWLCGLPSTVGTFFVIGSDTAERIRRCAPRHVHLVVMAALFSRAIETLPYPRAKRELGDSAYSTWGRLKVGCLALACVWECRKWQRDDLLLR
jgi:polyisoprenyl-phosphate glycosyltransferase